MRTTRNIERAVTSRQRGVTTWTQDWRTSVRAPPYTPSEICLLQRLTDRPWRCSRTYIARQAHRPHNMGENTNFQYHLNGKFVSYERYQGPIEFPTHYTLPCCNVRCSRSFREAYQWCSRLPRKLAMGTSKKVSNQYERQ